LVQTITVSKQVEKEVEEYIKRKKRGVVGKGGDMTIHHILHPKKKMRKGKEDKKNFCQGVKLKRGPRSGLQKSSPS